MARRDFAEKNRLLWTMMSGAGNRSIRFFYGLQPRWLSSDRLYRVYVCDKMVSVAYVAGQFYDEPSVALQLQAATHQLPVLHLPLSPLMSRLGFADSATVPLAAIRGDRVHYASLVD